MFAAALLFPDQTPFKKDLNLEGFCLSFFNVCVSALFKDPA